ncbi:metal-dependent hydrolase [Candidatus Babeliales bacterium]|nr:metal-dependent hydrolase [Candidatus Babeliales bacterium]
MPKYKTHLFGGFITFFFVIFIWLNIQNYFIHYQHDKLKIKWELLLLYFISCLLGSLFPDIDTKSRIQKLLYYPIFIIIVVSILLKNWILVSFLSILALIPILSNHRRLTHKLWFVILIPLSIPILTFHFNKKLLIPSIISSLFFMTGAISHLILDFGPKRFFKGKF